MLQLFLSFLQIGALSFGGGYAMISLIREQVLAHQWLSEEEFINMIAVAESTPGPIAINMATFIGAKQFGILGSLIATLGVVLPSFVIVLIIASILKNLLKFKGVSAFLTGVRPCIVALIFSVSLTMLINNILGFAVSFQDGSRHFSLGFEIDFKAISILTIICLASFAIKKFLKKFPSPLFLILLSAFFGIVFYSI